MMLRTAPWVALLYAMPLLASVAPPSVWVPARWNGTSPQSLDLLSGTPINCLLVNSYSPEFVTRAAARGIVTMAVLKPGADPADPARQAIRAGLQGIVLEGDFPVGTAARVRDMLAAAHAVVVEAVEHGIEQGLTPLAATACLARVIRRVIATSVTRNARAISVLVRPPTARKVRAICAAGDRAG